MPDHNHTQMHASAAEDTEDDGNVDATRPQEDAATKMKSTTDN